MKILLPLLIILFVDLIFPTLLSVKYPNYSLLHDTISTLSIKASPVRVFALMALFVNGVTVLIYSYWVSDYFETYSWSQNLYLIGLTVFGVASIIAGIFPEDPIGATETFNGKLHGIASGIGFLLLILNLIWAIFIPELSGYTNCHWFLFVIAVFSFGLFLVSVNYERGWMSYTGLFQRINLTILYCALIFHALILIEKIKM